MDSKKQNRKIVFNVEFNTWKRKDERLTKEWITERLDIFEHYPLQCLKAQTNQDFIVYLNYDPLSEEIMQNEMAQRTYWPANIYIGTRKANKAHMKKWITDSEYLFLVRLDSDDMYEKHFVQRLHDIVLKPDTQALICRYGYYHFIPTRKVGDYQYVSPPFYALIYKVEDYLDNKIYQFKGHNDVVKVLKYECLEGRNFMFQITGQNTLMEFDRYMNKKSPYGPEQTLNILAQFGVGE
ncbi:MAG: hypothetical protein E7231_05425 [Cellulosilyticum sp.]|nr:hypothetical protein [Cellulosilyticum sp.]